MKFFIRAFLLSIIVGGFNGMVATQAPGVVGFQDEIILAGTVRHVISPACGGNMSIAEQHGLFEVMGASVMDKPFVPAEGKLYWFSGAPWVNQPGCSLFMINRISETKLTQATFDASTGFLDIAEVSVDGGSVYRVRLPLLSTSMMSSPWAIPPTDRPISAQPTTD